MRFQKQAIIDFLLLICAGYIAYGIRVYVLPGASPFGTVTYMRHLAILALLTVLFFFHNNIYNIVRFESWSKLIFRILKSHAQVGASYIVFLYFLYPNRLSRATIVLYFVAGFIITLSYRLILRGRPHSEDWQKIILVGNSKIHSDYIQGVQSKPQLGVTIAGWIDSGGMAEEKGIKSLDFDIHNITENSEVYDAILIGYDIKDVEKQENWILHLNSHYITTMVLPSHSAHFIGFRVSDFFGIPIQMVNVPRTTQLDDIFKRTMDIIGAIFGIIITLPICIPVSILIKLTSRGPILFKQTRITKDGKEFTMFKFRSMKMGSEKEQSGWTTENDPRRTKFGTFLRTTSIDELPQFWNVLFGSMSLVGPRPEQPLHVDRLQEDIENYMLRHRMKGGITGWAQISGWRGDTSIERRIEFDLYYIKNWSIGFDIKILFLTIFRGFINENAY